MKEMTKDITGGIELKNITKKYGKKNALEDVSITFEAGKIYGLLGRNGAGKSTMLNIISNRIFTTSGEVFIDGEKSVENDKALSKIYCMSDKNLLPGGYKFKNVLKLTKIFYPDFDEEYALRLAAEFDLDINKKLQSYSTGYNCISKIILALASNAKYVFFDEPVLGLDANHREIFYRELLDKYINDGGTYIISTHLIEECANLIEKVVVVKNGRVIADEDTETLLETAYTVSGKAEEVDRYCQGKDVYGSDTIGGLKSAYIKGKAENVPDGLEISRANLQELFIQMTSDKNGK